MPARHLLPLVLLAAAPALAAEGPGGKPSAAEASRDYPTSPCQGTLSGAVQGSFTCRAEVRPHGQTLRLLFSPLKLPRGVGAFLPGELEVFAPSAGKTYTVGQLAKAEVRLSAAHKAYVARRQLPKQRRGKAPEGVARLLGEVTLRLDSLTLNAHEATARGRLTARLVPMSPKDKGEVLVQLDF
jgi:hypothetical protein